VEKIQALPLRQSATASQAAFFEEPQSNFDGSRHGYIWLTRGRTWAHLKKTLSGKQIREFYEVQAALWDPHQTNWADIVPEARSARSVADA
jgi:hypothetical protein